MRYVDSNNQFDQLPKGVRGLLIVNTVVFLLQQIMPADYVSFFAFQPVLFLKNYYFWQIVTYAFLHGNFWHLLVNMFALWMFGTHVERMMGTFAFLRFYFFCVIGAALAQMLVAPYSAVIGASGGIYGVLYAFAHFFPDSVIYLFFIFPMRALQAVLFIALITLVSSIGSGGSRIAHFAHLGGMATGFLLLYIPKLIRERGFSFKIPSLFTSRRKRNSFHVVKDDLTREVDQILEKISQQGVDSLTPDEHATMERYAKRKN